MVTDMAEYKITIYIPRAVMNKQDPDDIADHVREHIESLCEQEREEDGDDLSEITIENDGWT